MKLLTTCLATALLTGCASNDVNIHTAVLADSATTYHAIDSGKGEEANKLLPNSAIGAAVASAIIKYGLAYAAKKYGNESTCRTAYQSIVGSSFGAAASNYSVIAKGESSLPAGIGAGIAAGYLSKDSAYRFCNK